MPADSEPRFTIRRYQPGDEEAILQLFAQSFHQPRSPEHWRWKFRDNPAGSEHISVAFNGSQNLVAHYSAYPLLAEEGGRQFLIHQTGDTMTAPSVRHIGRGPTSAIGRTAFHFFETFCEGKVAFNYGFNVGNIQRFSERFLRSFRVAPVAYRTRDLESDPLPPLGRWERLRRGYRLELVHEVDGEWDAFYERVAPSYGMLIRRDARYLRWRYLSRPDIRYALVAVRRWGRLQGWIVFLVRDERLTLGDALFDPREAAGAWEIGLRHLAAQFSVSRIEGWFPSAPAWSAAILDALGLESSPEPQDLSLMCTPFQMTDAVERMRYSFYYTMGDSDLF